MYVSLKDVAERAGVSFQTASKVLNRRSGVVSVATRERIERAARELGYVPNALARGLVRRDSLTVGILADDFSDVALSRFVVAVQRTVERQGHAALVATTAPESAAPLRRLQEYRVNGIVVVAPSIEEDAGFGEYLRGPLPAVTLNHIAGGGVPAVGSDHRQTGALAAEHLVGLGHRAIGTVTGPTGRRVVGSRLGGFRATLDAAGVGLPEHRVLATEWDAGSAAAATHRLLDADPGITAIFAHNDTMAFGVLAALRVRGVPVPQACSVVGCDDAPLAGFAAPPLTTVRVPFEETGARAAELLLARIRGEDIPPRDLLPVHLVVRASTAPPP
ncbi:LacI family DNA-binding transcriptional regulator [Cryptosporangium aurantiacum]|uniref:Transcriptional regulator, LacI family n=1 Tax=Cryptosporangium aurantiacum TaxID=134849 RepID=A0A1M7RP04_9ACTN|nr:LacI family DNA-binding transcriptional regulator [Cryptosporangium aurantiacum]SHN47880.1 transcriptional regulator, LacI family [Cryptosporangium aurantiacum]